MGIRKFIITAEMRDLEYQVSKGEISYSKMIELLCDKAEEYFQEKALYLKNSMVFEKAIVVSERDHSDNEYFVIGVVSDVANANKLIETYYGKENINVLSTMNDSMGSIESIKVINVSYNNGEVLTYTITLEWFSINKL